MFPKRLVLKRPSSIQLRDCFEDVRTWSAALRSAPHVRLAMLAVRHRVIGANTLPHEAWVDTVGDAAALIGKRRDVGAFRKLLAKISDRQPLLVSWLAKKPIKALALGSDWDGLLEVIQWLQDQPNPGIYVRQMDVAGVDTKFVDSHRSVLAELLDLALPAGAIDESRTGVARFASRYGFKSKPQHVRIRILDPKCALLPWCEEDEGQELVLTAASFENLQTGAWRVIVTENEINFLALPQMEGTMAVFGAGYGLEVLGRARWLAGCRLYYWGDIDTHGFAILDELRSYFESVASLLMERETFLAFKPLWVPEPKPTGGTLSRLTPEEQRLYADLLNDRYGANLRLEQERIAFGWVEAALARLPSTPRSGLLEGS